MHKFISLDYQILPLKRGKISAVSQAALYGKGVFTTLRVNNSKPFLWEKHWRRLTKDANVLGIGITEITEKNVLASLEDLISKNNAEIARCRITFFDGSSNSIWQSEVKNKTSILIQTAEMRKPRENFSITVSPYFVNSASPLAGIKSCNYLENLIAFESAKERGFDEAVRINERGKITSASMANLFWLKDGELFTPSLKTGCLAGTTREFILEKRKVFEVEEKLETLEDAEAIFLTSSGIGVVGVRVFKKKVFSGKLNDLTQILE